MNHNLVNRLDIDARRIAVSVDHLAKTYPVQFLRLKKFLRRKFTTAVEALRDVSFNIHEGEIFGLIGPSLCGFSAAPCGAPSVKEA